MTPRRFRSKIKRERASLDGYQRSSSMDLLILWLLIPIVAVAVLSLLVHLLTGWIKTKESFRLPAVLGASASVLILVSGAPEMNESTTNPARLLLFSFLSCSCPFVTDQAVITELRNQIDALKAQHRDQIEQLKHERKSL